MEDILALPERRRSARLLAQKSGIRGTGMIVSADTEMDESYYSDGPMIDAMESAPELPEPDSFEALKPGEGDDWTKTGFDRGFEPKRVHSVQLEEGADGPVTKFTVEFYETRQWEEIPGHVVKAKCPDLVIAFYESRVLFDPDEAPENNDSDSDDDETVESSNDSDSSDSSESSEPTTASLSDSDSESESIVID